jgi:hypothetical protein
MTNLDELREMLKDFPPGPVNNDIFLALCYAWDEIEGRQATNLFASKLGRAEDIMWDPPNITFLIERHGAMSGGSNRAQLYRWTVNVETGTANGGAAGFRQIVPQDKPLNTKAIAVELREIIEKEADDPRVAYRNADRTEFKLIIADVFTANSKQTLTSRRKRFRGQFDEQLAEIGWEPSGRYIYRKKAE